jgi:hypothetical protein
MTGGGLWTRGVATWWTVRHLFGWLGIIALLIILLWGLLALTEEARILPANPYNVGGRTGHKSILHYFNHCHLGHESKTS